jgi:hypothetical protein
MILLDGSWTDEMALNNWFEGGLTVLRTVQIDASRQCQIVRINTGSPFRTILKEAIWRHRNVYPAAETQGWGETLFGNPWTGSFQPRYYAAIPDGAPAIAAALIQHDVVKEIDADAPPIVLAKTCWLAGVDSIFESATQAADVPIQVRSLADVMIEDALQAGETAVHILTDLPPQGATLLFGRPFNVVGQWKYRKQLDVIAAEIPIKAAA